MYLTGATLFTGDGLQTITEEISLEGVWELEYAQLYEDGLPVEIIDNVNGYRQVKMYSKGKVMWTRYDPSDPNEWFGYGSYVVKDGMLEEVLEFASGPMMKIIDTTQVFRFKLVRYKESFQQIQIGNDGEPTDSETFKRIE